MAEQETVLQYKGHPLMRKENIIYYGSMSDKYIIMMQILDSKEVKGLRVATRVAVQLQQTSPNVSRREKIVKKTEKDGLWAAMDIASIWLGRALNSK
ncbi:MAG: hypothetical protein HFH26_08400 [Clostridiaceae bacterium]|nr:hypothetical protein [Clostridiaceae bacterium]